ncbi:MAG: hydrogenase 2 operon protein HybA [Nitrospiraceae bacterium]|nr:hydrogenase 2 operon protein HybA [Nitrospiraceae bacterium]
MDLKRRDFIKGVACSSLLLAADAPSVFAAEPRKTLSSDALGILYDATLCVGCKACVAACKQNNDMPPDHTTEEKLYDDPIDLSGKTLNIIKLYKHGAGTEKDNETGYSYIKRHCMHCIDPSCISACPVKALTKNPKNGIVEYNKDACVGCRYCQLACPYNIPKFEWLEAFPQIRKCQLCSHLIKKGKISACCDVCPTGASLFGNVNDLLKEAKRRLEMKPGEENVFPVASINSKDTTARPAGKYFQHIYGEKEGGGTQVLFLAGVSHEKLGLPKLSDRADAAVSEGIQHGIYKGMIGPVALLAGLLFTVYKNTKKDDK